MKKDTSMHAPSSRLPTIFDHEHYETQPDHNYPGLEHIDKQQFMQYKK